MQADLIRSPRRGRLRWVEEDRGYATPCWIWQMARNHGDYGIWHHKGNIMAHRAVYEELRGPIPQGLQIDHLCRIHPCVNPDHLEPVTCKENLRRGLRGKKLTVKDVRVVKRGLLDGRSGASLAREFNVSEDMISRIKLGYAWADIEPEGSTSIAA